MFALFLLVGKDWKLHDIVKTPEEAREFKRIAQDMMNKPMLGKPITGYDVHELVNQAMSDNSELKVLGFRMGLTQNQLEQLTKSSLRADILKAAQFGRWDQVTLMLYQDGILERKTPATKN